MQKRMIKNQEVSLLGMGCMRLPKLVSGEIDIAKTEQMIDYAYRNGINYFDTAYPYHDGQSEIVIGQILKKYPRQTFLLADKLPIWKCNSLDDAKKIFNEQLNKCQVEYFDFYLCHAMNIQRYELYKKYDIFNYLLELKKEGKIRHLGFSFHDASQNIIPIIKELEWDFAQIQFNYLDYDMQDAKKQYEELVNHNISVVVMEPVRGGLLSDVCPDAKELFRQKRPNMTDASWALRYVASFKGVKVILSGMSNLDQLSDNINTFTNYLPLDDGDMKIISKAKKLILGNDFIPCTGCRYCMPCSFKVNIPQIFKIYNMFGIHKDMDKFKSDMNDLRPEELPINCRRCNKCVKQCPQHIDIPNKLSKISKMI